MTVDSIQNGIVIDHIAAGGGMKIYELLEERGLPLLLHTGDYRYDYSNTNRLKPSLETYTDLTVIAAHFGGWQKALALAAVGHIGELIRGNVELLGQNLSVT